MNPIKKVKIFTDIDELLESFNIPLSLESLGIENYGEWYIRHLPEQNEKEEFKKVNDFISEFISKTDMEELKGKKNIKFINYGDTQLVFVVTINEEKQYALLLNQPKTEAGQGLEEYNNLINLNKNHPDNVIKPLKYYVNPSNPQQELYITPYYFKARCVGVNEKDWGVWIPEPDYHFKDFNLTERKIINKCMIALVVKLYDEKNKKGISKWRFDGGDFMLLKGFEKEEINEENILKKLLLISARKLITIEFNEYVDKMRIELRNGLKEEDEKSIIGKNLRCPFSEEEIEEGIKFGMNLREKL
jgi:hypothetical protein